MVPYLTLTALVDGMLTLGLFVCTLITCIAAAALLISHTETRMKTGEKRIFVIESEIKNRVQGIEHWND